MRRTTLSVVILISCSIVYTAMVWVMLSALLNSIANDLCILGV